MRWDPKALAYTGAAIAGGTMAMVGLLNLASPPYGEAFLELMASLFPGYHAEGTVESVMVGTGYGVCDGAFKGWLAAILYNRLAATS